MQIQIKVIAVEIEDRITKTGKPYKLATITYKDLGNGKTGDKKIMNFNHADVYNTLTTCALGSSWVVDTEKVGEYRNWIGVKPMGASDVQASSSTSAKSATPVSSRGDWETKEERAKRQVFIVRQSSLSAAVATLKTEKSAATPEEVIELAERYTSWVMDNGAPKPAAANAYLSDMEDDIPM